MRAAFRTTPMPSTSHAQTRSDWLKTGVGKIQLSLSTRLSIPEYLPIAVILAFFEVVSGVSQSISIYLGVPD